MASATGDNSQDVLVDLMSRALYHKMCIDKAERTIAKSRPILAETERKIAMVRRASMAAVEKPKEDTHEKETNYEDIMAGVVASNQEELVIVGCKLNGQQYNCTDGLRLVDWLPNFMANNLASIEEAKEWKRLLAAELAVATPDGVIARLIAMGKSIESMEAKRRELASSDSLLDAPAEIKIGASMARMLTDYDDLRYGAADHITAHARQIIIRLLKLHDDAPEKRMRKPYYFNNPINQRPAPPHKIGLALPPHIRLPRPPAGLIPDPNSHDGYIVSFLAAMPSRIILRAHEPFELSEEDDAYLMLAGVGLIEDGVELIDIVSDDRGHPPRVIWTDYLSRL